MFVSFIYCYLTLLLTVLRGVKIVIQHHFDRYIFIWCFFATKFLTPEQANQNITELFRWSNPFHLAVLQYLPADNSTKRPAPIMEHNRNYF